MKPNCINLKRDKEIWALVGSGNINNANDMGVTALHIAASKNLGKVVTTLLEQNADGNKTVLGSTPLHIAIKNNAVDACLALIQNPNVDVNMHNSEYKSPLEHALIMNMDTRVVRALQERLNMGFNALHISAVGDNIATVEQLLSKYDVNCTTTGGNPGLTPLHLAILHGSIGTAVYLINKANANINIRNLHNLSAMYMACSTGHIDVVRAILGRPDYKKEEVTPIYIATLCGHDKLVEYLKNATPEDLCKKNIFGESIKMSKANMLNRYNGVKFE
jgi:ankyrin repeat protein